MGAAGSATGADEGAAAAAKAAADAAAAAQAVAAAEAKAKADAAAAAGRNGRPKAPRPAAAPVKQPEVMINTTSKNFMKRVREISEKDVQTKLGCSLEEAQRLLAAARAGTPAAGAAGAAAGAANDAESKKLTTEKIRLERENANLKNQLQSNRGKDKARIQELEDELEQKRVTDLARAAGFTDPGYAMYKFAEASASSETKLDEATYFNDLKTANPHLIAQTTQQVVTEPRKVGATSAPSPSTAPGGALPNTNTPAPPASGQAAGEKNVNDMTTQEFAEYSERTFGYRPGR